MARRTWPTRWSMWLSGLGRQGGGACRDVHQPTAYPWSAWQASVASSWGVSGAVVRTCLRVGWPAVGSPTWSGEHLETVAGACGRFQFEFGDAEVGGVVERRVACRAGAWGPWGCFGVCCG